MNDDVELTILVDLCKSELGASEVWLFGSRARGDARPGSDWDILAVIPDDAPEDIDEPENTFRVKRKSNLLVDLLTVRASDFAEARDTVNTISHAAASHGIRLDI
ncbi:nucleotidyltransferase domain-containing protein [Acidimangrovimonas pyrenivorans]|uniref:Nucleotidyltransferase domain-containing protein n=1 Tax=Acidimangrovimonas pyrenivorans TaxID=2030798 RepID=A0ABV7AE59_9RHOB